MNNIKIDKSTAMREANMLYKGGNITRSDAMRKGTMLAKLYAIFALGTVAHISFVKGDGTTRNADALPSTTGEYLIKGTGNATPKDNVLFCDAELGGAFRSFKKVNLLSVAA